MMNFCPMQARVPDPKGRNAAFSFGSFSTHELTPVIERSSVEPARVRYQKVRDRWAKKIIPYHLQRAYNRSSKYEGLISYWPH